MKRRESLHLIPLTFAGLTGMAGNLYAKEEPGQCHTEPCKNNFEMPLYQQYSKKVRTLLEWIRHNQSENLLEASYAIADTVKNGGKCFGNWDTGHSTSNDQFPDRNGEPVIFIDGYDPKVSKKGDLLLANRYGGPYDELRDKEIFVIGGPAPWSGDAKGQEFLMEDVQKLKIRPYSKIWIDTPITTIDADVFMPGEPAPIGPFSGIMGMIEYWMILADACRLLSRRGYKGKVKGDEPTLSSKTKWTGMDEPIMDTYYNTVLQQIDMIGAEMGDIREIAGTAVDALLSGGRVYYYSQYYSGLATEALGRRGGLALNKTTWEGDQNFDGNSKDIVIMGICRPDSDVDLKHLDQFKKAGMKIFSIGPATRDGNYSEKRTVPKETLKHIGRCCDTYGMFAFPGFDQKVCPTSGPVMNQIFWALSMEIAECIIRRTGNTPGVYFSAAIKGGNEHNALINQRCQIRGY